MRSYALLLLRHNIGKSKFFEAIDKALTRPITDKNKNDWPSPIEFAELCLPSPKELGLPSFEEVLKVFARYRAHKRSGSTKPFIFNSDFEEQIHFKCCARYRDVKEDEWLESVRAEYDYWVSKYRDGERPIIQPKLTIIPESTPRINRYIEVFGLPELGQDNLSQRIRELGMGLKSKTRAA